MKMSKTRVLGMTTLLAFGLSGLHARADVFRDVAIGLAFAGFDPQQDFRAGHNFFSGGTDLAVGTTFFGNSEMDFGPADLTLQGPISLQVATGGRGLSGFELSLDVGLIGVRPRNGYVLNYDFGVQSGTIQGDLFINADLKVNQLGSYDLQFAYSSQQDVILDGVLVSGSEESDVAVGPINIRGNILADVLYLLTSPFFSAGGQSNPLESFSGIAQWWEITNSSALRTREQLAAGVSPSETSLALVLPPSGAGPPGVDGSIPVGVSPLQPFSIQPSPGVTPEPSVLMLVLLSVPALLGRHRIRRALAVWPNPRQR